VTSVSVCDIFKDQRTLALSAPLLAILDSGLYGKNVHTIDLETGDVLATLVVVGESGGAVSSGTHSVLVV
jgi:hypothetical protein